MASQWIKSDRGKDALKDAAIILVAVLIAGVIRFRNLLPFVYGGQDEWYNIVRAMRVGYEAGNPGYFLHPSLYYYISAISQWLLLAWHNAFSPAGNPISAAGLFVENEQLFVILGRSVSAAFGAASAWPAFMISKRIGGRMSGALAAALLAALPLHVFYSRCVRVDAVFIFFFLWAVYFIARFQLEGTTNLLDRAAVFSGLATAANYNGALLVVWLCAAILAVRRESGPDALARNESRSIPLVEAVALSGFCFLCASPYIMLDFGRFSDDFLFQAGLSRAFHPFSESNGILYYAGVVLSQNIVLSLLVCLSVCALAVSRDWRDRLVCAFPVAYFVLFSIFSSRYDRFILPALAVFVVCVSLLPSRLSKYSDILSKASLALIAIAVFAMLRADISQTSPAPAREFKDAQKELFSFMRANIPEGSSVIIESDLLPLSDAMREPGKTAGELRKAVEKRYPWFNYDIKEAVFVRRSAGYSPDALSKKEADFVIVSARNREYVKKYGGRSIADAAEFYTALDKYYHLTDNISGADKIAIYRPRTPREK